MTAYLCVFELDASKTDTYGYFGQSESAMWSDGLKTYNGSAAFTYDGVGNPLTYNNGSSYTFTWQNGRELASGTKGSASFAYTYNSDGLRTKKIVGNTVYDYYWFGSQLAMMTITSGASVTTLKFYYADNGYPLMLDYNGTLYMYITNLQGDVIGLADSNGMGAYYNYDAWGNIVEMDSATTPYYNAMTANPLRYRGYIYDTETGFYYLRSRYYDPAISRFINEDGYISTGIGCIGYNMFAYCNNNPVNCVDPTGLLAYPAQIHNQVVKHINQNNQYNVEQKIFYVDENGNRTGKYGRADIISNDGYVWDVKPDKKFILRLEKNK